MVELGFIERNDRHRFGRPSRWLWKQQINTQMDCRNNRFTAKRSRGSCGLIFGLARLRLREKMINHVAYNICTVYVSSHVLHLSTESKHSYDQLRLVRTVFSKRLFIQLHKKKMKRNAIAHQAQYCHLMHERCSKCYAKPDLNLGSRKTEKEMEPEWCYAQRISVWCYES